jgi:mannose-6-phosphate isomerase class I
MKINLDNGTELDSNGGWASSLTESAQAKGFSNIICFLATHKDGIQEYVLVESKNGKSEAIHAHQNFEAMAGYIDIMKIQKDFDVQEYIDCSPDAIKTAKELLKDQS